MQPKTSNILLFLALLVVAGVLGYLSVVLWDFTVPQTQVYILIPLAAITACIWVIGKLRKLGVLEAWKALSRRSAVALAAFWLPPLVLYVVALFAVQAQVDAAGPLVLATFVFIAVYITVVLIVGARMRAWAEATESQDLWLWGKQSRWPQSDEA
ncbi:hypothetical protein C5E06_09755 [Pseudoclavibacter sp. RFBI5]|uniref:hypothetical protein n=1 Tax=Pseudoclavibacter sp. RFBI5 TaxID=2080578 RepID=UPI000CE8EDDC|nr:hypothetical protein [Pseudoclavibacter sp. RFBI5]PPG02728.1 hypothetical protein C5E06_09755 [Pseudoclavibacter sp. RFBI5]